MWHGRRHKLDCCAAASARWQQHIFLRRLRELISVTLQRGNAAFIRKWLDNCVPKSAVAQGDLDAEDAGAAALEGA